MITDIDIESELAADDSATPRAIRSFILKIVDTALRRHYGRDATIKCYQSSVAIVRLLEKCGIESAVWTGDMCVPEREGAWGGFWDDDPHCWVYTDKSEIVDLTLNRFHERPIAAGRGGPPLPAIWCTPDSLPPLLVYVPAGMACHDFNESDTEDLRLFLQECDVVEQECRQHLELKRVRFGPLIGSHQEFEEFRRSNHKWACLCADFESARVELPPYIIARIAELQNAH